MVDNDPMYCHCKYMTAMRDDRLQVRVDAASKRRLEDAASEMRLSLSAFVLQAAQRAADDVLAERQVVHLTAEAAQAFEAALTRPAEVNERLARSLKQPRKFSWLD